MTKKSMIFSIVLAATSSTLAAGLAIYGSYLFLPKAHIENSVGGKEESETNISVTESEIHFVEIKNVVVTLAGDSRANHYMLLDLVLTTDTKEQADKVNGSVALIKSSTVDLLTNMDYDTLNKMHVSELRQKLLDEYRKDYSELKLKVPFNDVMISKMVFQ